MGIDFESRLPFLAALKRQTGSPSSNSSPDAEPDTENDREGEQSSPQRLQQSQQPQQQQKNQQNQNRPAVPTLKGPYVVNLTDPAIAPLLDLNHKPSKADVIGPNGQCVDLTKKFTGMDKQNIAATRWRAGAKVVGNPDIPRGTAIATFDNKGRYPNQHNWNSGIYLGPGTNGSIWILDQWPGNSPRPREIRLDPSNKRAPADNSAFYHVIQVR